MPSEAPAAVFDDLHKWFPPFASQHLVQLVPGPRGEPVPVPGLGTFALEGVSIEVPRGQAVGLIGHNGAGKSTLLKILAGIYPPTSGRVAHAGRLAAIIELGVGFHPDLTGWENVRMAAALLGVAAEHVPSFTSEAVEFSGLGTALDKPVRQYSSGMLARLGFAVATHSGADVLAVDEAIAVGDREFQVRCLERIGSLIEGGTTLLLVTHDLWLVTQLCDRAVLLDHGSVVDDGPPEVVVPRYLESVGQDRPAEGARLASAAGATVGGLRVCNDRVTTGDPLVLEATVQLPTREGLELETTFLYPPFGPFGWNRSPLPEGVATSAVLRGVTNPLQAVGRATLAVNLAVVEGRSVLARAGTEFDLEGEAMRKPFGRLPFTATWSRVPADARERAPVRRRSEPVVQIVGLSKRFPIPPVRRARLLAPVPYTPSPSVVALDDVTVEVGSGEFVGLIGPNGAGKSTLLKVIAGITRGDEGEVVVEGKVVSMIELGVGFHPDLTGFENLRATGQLLGLDPMAIEERLDAIAAFADIGPAIAGPVKHLSTGMRARLGFALASNVPADVLLVDEMLAVGDAEFRDRAIDRMQALHQAGTTVLLVSHDLRLVAEVCDRAVLIERGRVTDDGPAAEVVDRFGGTDLVQSHVEGHLPTDDRSSVRVSQLVVHPRSIPSGGTVQISARLELDHPPEHLRIDLCTCEPFTDGWARSGDPNEVYDRAITAESISSGLDGGDGVWALGATLTLESMAPGPIDVVVVAVDTLSGEILSEARRPLRIRGQDSSRPGLRMTVDWEVVEAGVAGAGGAAADEVAQAPSPPP